MDCMTYIYFLICFQNDPGSSFIGKTILQTHPSQGKEIIKTEFHIVYSPSYEVPVLYFTVTKTGEKKVIPLDVDFP